ncbi:hypothetical protein IW262DRAFT_1297700 [Armillaria fumosa]|nr:hypothetical protein IW262DRAFT_1297700 [Armillaria fumosa]
MHWYLVLLMSIIISFMLVGAFPSLQNSSSTETVCLRASPAVWLRAGTLRCGSEINLKITGDLKNCFWHHEELGMVSLGIEWLVEQSCIIMAQQLHVQIVCANINSSNFKTYGLGSCRTAIKSIINQEIQNPTQNSNPTWKHWKDDWSMNDQTKGMEKGIYGWMQSKGCGCHWVATC